LEKADLLPCFSFEVGRMKRRREIAFIRSAKKEIPALVSVSFFPNEKSRETKFTLVIAVLVSKRRCKMN
jgi:hypothetical protein